MKRGLTLIFLCVILCGCSFLGLPSVFHKTSGSIPEDTQRHYEVTKCTKGIEFDNLGNVIKCNGKFYSFKKLFNQKERKLTRKEWILNSLANLQGWLFYGFWFLLFFAPGVLGAIVGWICNRFFGGTTKTLITTMKAIDKAKNNGGNYLEELKKAHAKDPVVMKTINELRAKISLDKKGG